MYYADLPNEILELIFSSPATTKRDLLQLQLTCKQWSPAAQKYLYQEIKISGRYHEYGTRLFGSLVRSSLRANTQLGKYIKSFDFGCLFPDRAYNGSEEDLSSGIAALAQLCPNLTILEKEWDNSVKFLETLTRLHRQGYLQRLEFITPPAGMKTRNNAPTYDATILEFKDTIKSITIIDDSHRTQPTFLQLFTSAEHVCLLHFSRVHIYRIKDYISNCGPHIKSVYVKMYRQPVIVSLQDEYNDPSDVHPQRNVQDLTLDIRQRITTNELAFVMRLFPSLKKISFGSQSILDDFRFDRADMQVIVQFFGYLSQMTEFSCGFKWYDISIGLDLLPHLAISLGIKKISIASSMNSRAEICIHLMLPMHVYKHSIDEFSARSKTKGAGATIEIPLSEAQEAFFPRAVEGLKSKSIESVAIGRSKHTLKVEQHLIDYMVDHYKGLQELTFNTVEFLWNAPLSAVHTVKHLRSLHLDSCNITEKDFTRLSWQFQQIDHFKLSTDQWSRIPNVDKKIKIHLPFTTLKTVSITMHCAMPYTIKIWTTGNSCIMLKATCEHYYWKYFTLKEIADNQSLASKLYGYYEYDSKRLVNYLKECDYSESLAEDLEEIRYRTATFKMPQSPFQQ
ncbi:hypothetical protein MBANPS3_003583 [Mucor bainieri]